VIVCVAYAAIYAVAIACSVHVVVGWVAVLDGFDAVGLLGCESAVLQQHVCVACVAVDVVCHKRQGQFVLIHLIGLLLLVVVVDVDVGWIHLIGVCNTSNTSNNGWIHLGSTCMGLCLMDSIDWFVAVGCGCGCGMPQKTGPVCFDSVGCGS